MKIVWTREFEIGINVIDMQHRRIVEYINDLNQVVDDGAPLSVLASTLMNLVDYTVSHFAFEEALMEEAGYPDLIEHKLTHKAFVQQLTQLQVRFEEGDAIASDLGDMLQQWLLKHIVSDDRGYCSVVQQNLLSDESLQSSGWIKQATSRFFQ